MAKIDKKKFGVFIGIVIAVIVIIVIIVNAVNGGKKNNEAKSSNEVVNNNTEIEIESIEEYEKNKNESMDIKGTENVDKAGNVIVNNSNKLDVVKKLNGVEISNINVKYSDATTKITGVISNKTSKDIDLDMVKINIIDNSSNIVKTFNSYIGNVKANETRNLDLETQADISNLSDITFVK